MDGVEEVRFAVDDTRELAEGEERAIANRGHFSERFFRRMESALTLAPALLGHIVSLVSSQSRSDDRVDTSRDSPAPWNSNAVNDANEQYAALVRWVDHWSERMRVPRPSWPLRGWRNADGKVVGLPPSTSPGSATDAVSNLTEWLLLRLESICWLDVEEVQYFHDELRELFALNARYPRKEPPRYSDVPCPADQCGGRVAVYPPRGFKDDALIICELCGRIFRPGDWEHLSAVFTQIRREQARELRAQRGLSRKYSEGASS